MVFVAQVIDKVITILIYAIVIRAVLSYFPKMRSNKLSLLLDDVTEPILKPFQRFSAGAIDFSPLIAIIALNLIRALIVRLIMAF